MTHNEKESKKERDDWVLLYSLDDGRSFCLVSPGTLSFMVAGTCRLAMDEAADLCPTACLRRHCCQSCISALGVVQRALQLSSAMGLSFLRYLSSRPRVSSIPYPALAPLATGLFFSPFSSASP